MCLEVPRRAPRPLAVAGEYLLPLPAGLRPSQLTQTTESLSFRRSGCLEWPGNGTTAMVSMRFTMGHSLSSGAHFCLRFHISTIRGTLWCAILAACNGRIIHSPLVVCVSVGPMEAERGEERGREAMCVEKRSVWKNFRLID